MSLRTLIMSHLMESLTGEARLQKRRRAFERKRAHGPHVVSYYHQVDDPYCFLAVQALRHVAEAYDVVIVPHLVGPPAAWAAPEPDLLSHYAMIDAVRLARRHGLAFPSGAVQPGIDAVAAANSILVPWLGTDHFFEHAIRAGETLWSGGVPNHVLEADVDAALAAGEARRQADGHFMSGTLHYGGEWYWGIDRLHYLESRLIALHTRRGSGSVLFPCPMEGGIPPSGRSTVPIEFFLSFRSPYTWLALARAKRLADAWGVAFNIRFVLPMVMRGLPVPRMKGHYFSQDAAREARRMGIPFGRIADPVGKPVERGYSLIPHAREQGRVFEYCQSFMQGVWAEGLDAGSTAGLRTIATRAGLDWSIACRFVGNDDWREEAETNRKAMFEIGHWGVPCLRAGEVVAWGQDRLWVIEDELKRRSSM